MDTSQVRSLLICVFYAASSTSISLVNKAVLSSFHFTGTFLLLASQQFGALVVMYMFKMCHALSVGQSILPEIPDFNASTFRKSLFVSVLFVGNVGSAFIGLRIVDVPLFLCVRRLTTLCVLGAEYLLLNKVSPANIRASIGLIMVGAILAGYETLSTNWIGYCFVMSNNILTAWLYTEQKKLCDDTVLAVHGDVVLASHRFTFAQKLTPFGLLYYNALVALPLSLCLAYLLGEVDDFAVFPHRDNTNWQAGVLVSSLLGVVMTYSIVLCNSVNSPLATSVTGNIKDIVGTALGWMVFGGFIATPASVSGLVVSFVGSGWYSYIKLTEKKPVQVNKSPPSDPQEPVKFTPLPNDAAVNSKPKLLETGPRLRTSPAGTPLRGTPTKVV